MTEYTYARRASSECAEIPDSGDTVIWRSASLSDGSPATPAYRAADSLCLLDMSTSYPWYGASKTGHPFALAPIPYAGSLATVLSDLVERVA